MTRDERVAEVKRLLEGWAAGFAFACQTKPSHHLDPTRGPSLGFGSRGLASDEGTAFLRAYEAGLVIVDPDGRFRLPGARACSDNLHLVGRSGDHVALHTEYLVHLGAYGELVLDHGWSRSQLSFERGEFDIWGHDDVGEVVLAVEAKARAHRPHADSLESLLGSFERLACDPEATVPKNHLRKWIELLRLCGDHPVMLWLVADGARWYFDVTRAQDSATVTRRDGVPSPRSD